MQIRTNPYQSEHPPTINYTVAMRYLMLAAFALVTIGCGSGSEESTSKSDGGPGQSRKASGDASSAVLSIEGPGGTVALGDDLEAAQTAFPAPDGARVFDSAMSFTILGVDGWAWAGESDDSGFEVAAENGKVIALIRPNRTGEVTDEDIAAQRTAHGNPTAEAVSENAAMLVWESGENARFYVAMRREIPLFGSGAFTIIGPKDKQNLLNYHYDQPELYVSQIDALMQMDTDSLFGEPLDED